MTYLSKNKKEFNTIREAEAEDRRYDAEIAAAEKEKNEKLAAKAKLKGEIDAAFSKFLEAGRAYVRLVEEYTDKYDPFFYSDNNDPWRNLKISLSDVLF